MNTKTTIYYRRYSKYIEEHYPNEIFDMNKLYVRLFQSLSLLNHLNAYGENYECFTICRKNVGAIFWAGFINYVSTLIEGNGKTVHDVR